VDRVQVGAGGVGPPQAQPVFGSLGFVHQDQAVSLEIVCALTL
jgi:hypothetical protein